MMMIMAEADENEDNIIQYEEFVPVCVELLQAFRVRRFPPIFFHLSVSPLIFFRLSAFTMAETVPGSIIHSSCL